jgi:hypothetical protein
LGRRLKETIDGFRLENPNTTGSDIRQAVSLATRGVSAGTQSLVIALAGGLVLLGLLGFLYFNRQGDGGGQTVPMTSVAVAAVAVLGLKAFFRNR